MEQQLVGDLNAHNMIAVASSQDIEDVTAIQPDSVKAHATRRNLLAVLVINEVAADGSGSIVKNPRRISPTHPTLNEFYLYSKQKVAKNYSEDREVFAEVNLFVLDDEEAQLVWSGTTWSFRADNKGNAVRDISDTVAKQLAILRDRYR